MNKKNPMPGMLLASLLLSTGAAHAIMNTNMASPPPTASQQTPPPPHRMSDQIRRPIGAPLLTSTSKITASISQLMPSSGATVNSSQITLNGMINHSIYPSSLITATINGSPIRLGLLGDFSVPVTLTAGTNLFVLRATTANPRQQITEISSFLDASMVYGSDTNRANALRSFTSGKLKTSGSNLLPLNTNGLANANDAMIYPNNQLFLAGDVRANENIELTAIQTLFMREHNQIASALAARNPNLTDAQLYQQARRIVIAEVQAITYQEFLPALLGSNAIPPYIGYNPKVNPGISTEFSTAAYRIGHTLVNDDIDFLDNDGNQITNSIFLAEAFFNPTPIKTLGIDPLIKYLATDNAQEVDTQLVDSLRNFLFGAPGDGGFDLASLNIQRGRDHGLAGYNSVRAAYGLPKLTSFMQITTNTTLQNSLALLYSSVDQIDLWIGGLAEDHVAGSSVGPTFRRIMVDQFTRLRDGDSNWYERAFFGSQLAAIKATHLSDVIRRNTTITKIQDNVFFYDSTKTLSSLTAKTGVLPTTLIQCQAVLMPPPVSLDGKGNNMMQPLWGSAGSDLLRFSAAAYTDNISAPSGSNRPSARLISDEVCVLTTTNRNDRNMSSYVYGWGQFIDHDLDLTTTGTTEFDISVPKSDPDFDPNSTGTNVISFTRSNYDTNTGTSTGTATQTNWTIVFTPRQGAAPGPKPQPAPAGANKMAPLRF
jgi:hypothetical protein